MKNIQSIAVNLRTETGRLVPFAGGEGKVVLTLKFQNFLIQIMEAYYHNQATMPHFSGHYRQRGIGFGALAMGIGRVALPLARKFIVPVAKRIGKELLVQAAPELIDIATKKKTPEQALKNTVKNTIKNKMELVAASPV